LKIILTSMEKGIAIFMGSQAEQSKSYLRTVSIRTQSANLEEAPTCVRTFHLMVNTLVTMKFATIIILLFFFSFHGSHLSELIFEESQIEFQEFEFELIKNQIIVNVEINEKELKMMLDTGGNPSIIGMKTASENQWVDTTKWGYASGVGDEKIKIYLSGIHELVIQGQKYQGISAVAMDLGEISEKLGLELSGILGYSFLKDKIIQFDYPSLMIRMFSQGTDISKISNIQNHQTFKLQFPKGKTIPLIKGIKINNYVTDATMDTGSSLDLDISIDLLDSISIDETLIFRGDVVYGASGEKKTNQIEIDSIRLGVSKVLRSRIAVIIDEAREPGEIGLNIGNGILREFIVTLDYINGIMLMGDPM